MAQNDPNPNSIDNIRSILFGDQVAQFEERFALLDQAINSLRSENRNLRQALENELTLREQAVSDLQNKINDLQEEIQHLNKKTDANLQKYVTMQAELVNTLEKELKTYKEKLGISV